MRDRCRGGGRCVTLAVVGVSLLVGAILTRTDLGAHRPIESQYAYHKDIFPILEARCGRCHVAGGVAPMSLLTYEDAFPWAEAIRDQVLALNMPPWHAQDGVGAFEHAQRLTAREIDVLLDWSVGGTPEGDRIDRPRPTVDVEGWPLGEPDMVLAMPADYTVDADTAEEVRFFLLDGDLLQARWLRAVDVRPGAPRVVRSATVYADPERRARELGLRPGPEGVEAGRLSSFEGEGVLAAWLPGQTTVGAAEGSAFPVPAGSDLVLRVHYRKTWNDEGIAVSDRSQVGLYFAPEPVTRPIQSLVMSAGAWDRPDDEWNALLAVALVTGNDEGPFETVGSVVTLDRAVDIVALLPEIERPAVAVRVEVRRPGGEREAILHLERPSPAWERRYWLRTPISLPAGTSIDLRATFQAAEAAASNDSPNLRLLIDTVPPLHAESAARALPHSGVPHQSVR